VPAQASFGCFAEDGFVFSQLAENLGAFAAELVGIGFEHRDQGSQGAETFFWRVPLGRRKATEEIGIAATFLDQESHGVLVGGEKLEQGFDAKLKRELGWAPRYPSAREGVPATVAERFAAYAR